MALGNLRLSNDFYTHKKKEFDEKEKLSILLYQDISNSKQTLVINPIDRKYSMLLLEDTSNSIYGVSNANVLWFVHTDNNTLTRIESFGKIRTDGSFTGEEKPNINKIETKCEIFQIIKQPNGTIVFLKFEGKEPLSYFIQQTTN